PPAPNSIGITASYTDPIRCTLPMASESRLLLRSGVKCQGPQCTAETRLPPPWRTDVGTKRAGPIDAVVGRTIRALRLSKGASQGALGRRLGVSFQQIQKYENGTNRVGAGRLAQIAMALDVPMEALLQGVQTVRRRSRPGEDPLSLLSSGQAMRL